MSDIISESKEVTGTVPKLSRGEKARMMQAKITATAERLQGSLATTKTKTTEAVVESKSDSFHAPATAKVPGSVFFQNKKNGTQKMCFAYHIKPVEGGGSVKITYTVQQWSARPVASVREVLDKAEEKRLGIRHVASSVLYSAVPSLCALASTDAKLRPCDIARALLNARAQVGDAQILLFDGVPSASIHPVAMHIARPKPCGHREMKNMQASAVSDLNKMLSTRHFVKSHAAIDCIVQSRVPKIIGQLAMKLPLAVRMLILAHLKSVKNRDTPQPLDGDVLDIFSVLAGRARRMATHATYANFIKKHHRKRIALVSRPTKALTKEPTESAMPAVSETSRVLRIMVRALSINGRAN